jgi:hypothetical protein
LAGFSISGMTSVETEWGEPTHREPASLLGVDGADAKS